METQPQPQQTEATLMLEGRYYDKFLNGIKSEATRIAYVTSLRRYMDYLRITDVNQLLMAYDNPIDVIAIEDKIIEYIMSLRNAGVACATTKFLVAPIFTFYALNRVVLNRRIISKYFGDNKRVARDKSYTTEQIQQALQNADQRMRCVILLMASTGCRVGALPGLPLGNLQRLPGYDLYKITFYEGTSSEYYSFTTRECASTGIDNYLLYRKRCGENIVFNQNLNRWEPPDTPLIRVQFDMNDSLQARRPRPMKLGGLRFMIHSHLIRSGLRVVEHPTENKVRVRKSVSVTNGFRKHVISTFIENNLNYTIREFLVGHLEGLDRNYFRPEDYDKQLQEYLKAEPYLTIDPSVRLAQQNQILQIDRSRLEERIDRLEQTFSKFLDH
jgi:hypothetical protein